MMCACITANESHFLDQPFDVAPRAAELLIQNGWTPPTNQDPKGSFLLPTELP